MLVLSRKVGESIHIGNDITIFVSKIDCTSVRISISAPWAIPIARGEIHNRAQRMQNMESGSTEPL